MDIIIQSLGFNAGASLETFIQDKVGSLRGDHIVRATVTLYKGPAGNPDSDYCEIRLEVPGNDPFVKKHSAHFETSVNECVEVLSQQLRKIKDRNKSRQGDAAAIHDAILEAAADDTDVELEDVVR
ncbi:MAG: HPF/RaiA family ribosome-associated protein [Chitinophagaceae bacterium]